MIVLTVRVINEADRNLTESVTQGNLTICEALVDTNEEGEGIWCKLSWATITPGHWLCPSTNQITQASISLADGKSAK